MSEQAQMEQEAHSYFTMVEFIDLFEADPKGITQELLKKFPEVSQHLSYLLTYYSITPKILS